MPVFLRYNQAAHSNCNGVKKSPKKGIPKGLQSRRFEMNTKPPKATLMRTILFLILLISFSSSAFTQPCTENGGIDKIPGKFVEQKTNQIGGNSYCETGTGNATALKTLKAIQAIVAKNFWGDGTVAKGFFSGNGGEYFNDAFLASYMYKVGFYGLLCRDSKLITAHEYGTDLTIAINPGYPAGENIISSRNSDGRGFQIPGTQKDRSNEIPLFRYLIFRNKDEVDKINNGTGYYEGPRRPSSAYDKNPDITRYWFLTPPGKNVLVPVTRKEFLYSLLEFYEKELPQHIKEMNRLIKINGETLAQYETDKDKDAKSRKNYEEFKKWVAKHRSDSAHYQESYVIKKNKVNAILKSNSPDWLNEPAVATEKQVDQGYCRCESRTDFEESGCYTFNKFAEDGNGITIYKWNPEIFKPQNSCNPVFIRVSLRYKFDIGFSEKIRDHYTNKLDFAALRKLLVPSK